MKPPIGDLRFRASRPPRGRNTSIDDGSISRICPQVAPAGLAVSETFASDYLQGKAFNASAYLKMSNQSNFLSSQDPRSTEDCLFLDVIVPQTIFLGSGNKTKDFAGAPVMVWIHGGGYVEGEKGAFNPAGLIKAAQVGGAEGIVFVAINYRLGAFGWLSGPSLQIDGTANAGLYDQRLALQWVQNNIYLFGGDPKRVTAAGESAGGGSILHQITAFAGRSGPTPFQQVIVQSPFLQIMDGYVQEENVFKKFLSLANVTTLRDARQQKYEVLQAANVFQIVASDPAGFTFGPVVDGLFAPLTPGKLLLQGSFDHNLKLMLGHNADEGLLFTSQFVRNGRDFHDFVSAFFPSSSSNGIDYIENVLYPPPPALPGMIGLTGYSDEIGRIDLAISESTLTCNTFYLAKAFSHQTYAYQFSVPPALHGQDLQYTFFNSPKVPFPSFAAVQDAIAIALQEYISSFIVNGTPSGPSLPDFPLYSQAMNVIDLNVTGISIIKDPIANNRCNWWQQGLYA